VFLCPLLHSTVCVLSVPHTELSLFSVSPMTLSLQQSLHGLSVTHTVPSVCSVSTYQLLISTVFHRLSVTHAETIFGSLSLWELLPSIFSPSSHSTSPCTGCWFRVPISTAVFFCLSNVFKYVTFVRSVGSVSLCSFLFYYESPISVSKSHYTLCWFCFTMYTTVSHVYQYHMMYCLLFLCNYYHCSFPQSEHCPAGP
jgi:hypothetical protein